MRYLLIAALLTGCGNPFELDWERAYRDYECSDAQMAKTEREAKAAEEVAPKERTGSYWYGNAIMRNCKLKTKP